MFQQEISPEITRIYTVIANAYFLGSRPRWILADAGTPGCASEIKAAAETRFGPGAKPAAIVLTHGHFDHAGSARALAELWDVPIYAHHAERPFLTGASAYPPKDPTIGGAMGLLSRFFPSRTVDLGGHLHDLPPGGIVPGIDGWVWHHTPGHAPGHVSLYHQKRSLLIAGDAVTTVDLDSWRGLITQARRVSRPPAPFTYDWEQARRSVEFLAALRPVTICAGHGEPMSGPEAASQLEELARNFPAPPRGRYARTPARADDSGVVFAPAPAPDPLARGAAVGAAALAGAAVVWFTRKDRAASTG